MRSLHWNPMAFLVALSLACMPAAAHADDLEAELEKLVKEGSARFSKLVGQKLDEVLREAQKGFVEAVGELAAKHVAAAETKLKAEIAARDKKISELEARIQRLEQDLASARKKNEWPARNLTGAYLGVGHVDVPRDLASELKVEDGALVTNVITDSPAAAAGLKRGDVIVSVNGKAVSSQNLQTAVRTFEPGATIRLAYVRDGKREEKEASLVDLQEFWNRTVEPPQPVVLGIIVAEDNGLLVTEVEDGFTGKAAGLKVGDRLVSVGGAAVSRLEDVTAALSKVRSGDRLELTVKRGDESLAISVIGSHEKGKAKLLASKTPEKKEEKKPEVARKEEKEEKKPEVAKPAKKAGYLGVDIVAEEGGPVITAVLPETTASAYGLKAGDVFRKLNGKDVSTTDALVAAMKEISAGDKITVVIARGGEEVTLSDVVVAAEGEKVAAVARPEPKPEKKADVPEKPGSVGVVAQETTDGRVIVKSLIEGGAAEKGGLKPDDVILEANGKTIQSFADLGSVLGGLHAGDVVSFKIRREDKVEDLKVTLGEKSS